MNDNKLVGEEIKQTSSRRRGEVLENAILEAAWHELIEVGYTRITMEGVAARAKTNKAVVYRRWPNKAKLVVEALHKYTPEVTNDTPNTGNLRDDVLMLLRMILQPLQTIGSETIHGLILDLGKELISSLPQINSRRKENKLTKIMITILENAEKRGEAKLEKINPRIVSLPIDLLRYEILFNEELISDTTLIDIVDNIFMPLVHK